MLRILIIINNTSFPTSSIVSNYWSNIIQSVWKRTLFNTLLVVANTGIMMMVSSTSNSQKAFHFIESAHVSFIVIDTFLWGVTSNFVIAISVSIGFTFKSIDNSTSGILNSALANTYRQTRCSSSWRKPGGRIDRLTRTISQIYQWREIKVDELRIWLRLGRNLCSALI